MDADTGKNIVAPNPALILESLRSIGYSLENAIADIIDNSISDSQPKVNTSDKISSKKSSESGKRFSMEEIDPAKMGEPTLPRRAGTMSDGQYKKRIADLTKALTICRKRLTAKWYIFYRKIIDKQRFFCYNKG